MTLGRPGRSRFSSQTTTIRSGARKGSGSIITAWTSVKMAVLAPMPRARVAIVTAAKPGLLRSERAAKRRSRRAVSRKGTRRRSRRLSLVASRPPSFSAAARRASSGVMPARRLSSVCIWR